MTRTLSTLPSPVTAGDYRHTRSYFQPVVLTSRSYSRLENHLSNPFLPDYKIPTLLFHYNGLFLISFSHSFSHARHYLSLSYTHIILYVCISFDSTPYFHFIGHAFIFRYTHNLHSLSITSSFSLSNNNQNNIHRLFFSLKFSGKMCFSHFFFFLFLKFK